MAFCTRCGSELTGRFCAACGAPAESPGPPAVADVAPANAPEGAAPSSSRRSRRRVVVGSVAAGLIAAAAVPAVLVYRDRAAAEEASAAQQAKEGRYVNRAQRALEEAELVDGPVPASVLLAVGRDMCGIYADGGDLGDAMEAYAPEAAPRPTAETVEEFIDRTAEPLTQIMVNGYLAAGAAKFLCPEHGVLEDAS